jgi:putative glutamine amidotransferase
VRPLIGITSYPRTPIERRPVFTMPCKYVDAVRDAGGIPVVLPPFGGELSDALDAMAGVMLPGGGDLDPRHYDGSHHETLYDMCPERDGFELALMRQVLSRPDMPVLAICRGIQVLNVALGGDLVTHLEADGDGAEPHRAPHYQPLAHRVRVDPQSQLASILGTAVLEVQSIHHQAVGRLGRGLRAVAWSEDGVVEAVEHDDHPALIAVQWHPELGVPTCEPSRRMFRWFVERCADRVAPPTAMPTARAG